MNPHLAFEIAVSILTLYQNRGTLDAGLVAVQVIQYRHLIIMPLGKPQIHSVKHLHPILGLGTAGTGVEGEDGVVLIEFTA